MGGGLLLGNMFQRCGRGLGGGGSEPNDVVEEMRSRLLAALDKARVGSRSDFADRWRMVAKDAGVKLTRAVADDEHVGGRFDRALIALEEQVTNASNTQVAEYDLYDRERE